MTASAELTMSIADQLFAIEQIKQVKSKYAYSADRHKWDDFASVFAPDAVFDESDFPTPLQPYTKDPVPSTLSDYFKQSAEKAEWPLIGRDAILAAHVDLPDDHVMVHHIMDPYIVLTSDSTATARFRFESYHWFPVGRPVKHMHNIGAYHETYVRLDDGNWYIHTFKLERQRVECV
ncbi:nuclear transport factor 2 family protein [Arthrobacter sp. 2MCAF14]|uniref:nuclear transport factor 2 family protein n=1 Tax=Arthrobacter sp. 2MCAF14 TaxID=3232982 RepID=UPI003F912413